MGKSIAEFRNDMKDSLKVGWMHDAREAMWCNGGVDLAEQGYSGGAPERGADSSA